MFYISFHIKCKKVETLLTSNVVISAWGDKDKILKSNNIKSDNRIIKVTQLKPLNINFISQDGGGYILNEVL